MYNIDRKTASRLLKTSVRTVDRYIASKKLSIEKRDGRIWLNKNEIFDFRKKKKVDNQSRKGGEMSIDKKGYGGVDMSMDSVNNVSTSDSLGLNPQIRREHHFRRHNTQSQESVYKNLFEEAKEELKRKQEFLEGANYRVGQLEAMLKDTVPLLDHQRALNSERQVQQKLQENYELQAFKTQEIEKKLKEERTDKTLYLILLFIILLLQPLWLFLAYR